MFTRYMLSWLFAVNCPN